ncbi:hypothetical protein [Clostridium prolinivorans]|uniref:hypothetical protein n=1 Tax=Clostridium prolinivorans TaxID=2769420 RepID=UPI000FDA4838|nr:hypothetical protein [Clostridium prolinivorans]
MWGQYEAIDGSQDVITINFGHSKAKRDDKKQIKMSRPTLWAIFDIFITVRVRVIKNGKSTERQFVHPLNDSIKKVLRYLGISEDIFIQGTSKS